MALLRKIKRTVEGQWKKIRTDQLINRVFNQ